MTVDDRTYFESEPHTAQFENERKWWNTYHFLRLNSNGYKKNYTEDDEVRDRLEKEKQLWETYK